MDFDRQYEGDHLKGIKFGARFSVREKSYLHRHQDYTSILTTTLPADLFTNYSVTEFDAPPLLNGDYQELAELVYGGMPVDNNAIVQSSTWGVDEDVTEAYGKVTLRRFTRLGSLHRQCGRARGPDADQQRGLFVHQRWRARTASRSGTTTSSRCPA